MGGATPQQTTQTGNTSQSQNTTSTTGPNPYIQPMLQQGVQGLSSYFNNNPQAPGYYPGSTVAAATPQMEAARQAMFARGASGSPLQAQGNNFASSVLDPNYLNVGNDPNFKASLAAGFAPQNENFDNIVAPNARSQFEGSGRNLGGADMSTYATLRKGLDQTQSNSSAQAVEQAYQARMANQFNVLNNYIPTSQNMDYQNLGAMGQAAQSWQNEAQAGTDANVARYNFNSMAQPNYVSDFLSRINAGYPGGQTTGQGTSFGNSVATMAGMPSSNNTSSFLGGGLGLAGLGLQGASMFGGGKPGGSGGLF